jgi:hypothetical protein
MNYLRSLFEEQLQIGMDAEGNAVIGESVFTPALILAYDTTAYDAEFNAWLSGQWLPEQDQRREAILSRSGNRKRFADLCSAVKSDQVVPLVGSGMCVPTGLLTWSEFLRSIRKYSKLSQEELDRLLDTAAFEEAADRLAATMPGRLFNERVEHDLRVDEVNAIDGPICHLPDLFSALVLTTNLDDVLEQLYSQQEQVFSHVLGGTDISLYRTLKAASESFLLKLHGDRRNTEGRVLGRVEYDQAYAADGVLCEELALIIRTKNILFLGCSLMYDRTVQLVAKVATCDLKMPKHYAFLKEPLEEEIRIEREHFLTERGIYPIWYQDDHDESIEALFVGILRYLGRL